MQNRSIQRPQDSPFFSEPQGAAKPPRTWVQLLAVDSQLSYHDPWDFARWVRAKSGLAGVPPAFRWAALALWVSSLPALILAAGQLAQQPSVAYLPWFICSLLAGLWAFNEVPGNLRITVSACVTAGAFATGGFGLGVACGTITALSSWAVSGAVRRPARAYVFLANWSNLVLSAAAGAITLELILGMPGQADLAGKLASNRFLLAFPAGVATYVLTNTALASLSLASLRRSRWAATWKEMYSGVGLLFSIGMLQALSFIIAFGSWGALGAGEAGTFVAFLVILILLGAGKQCVLQHEAREHILCMAEMLRAATRPRNGFYPFSTYLLDRLLTQGTRRFLSGIPTEELTFEAEEAVLDAEIAWKLGASRQSIRAYLAQHETPTGTGPFGLKELGMPVWSPAFPERVERPGPENGDRERGRWSRQVLRSLLDAARPPDGHAADENRKWNRLALSGARTVHSIVERYDFGRRLSLSEDQEWWTTCELAGFGLTPAPEGAVAREDPEPSPGC